MESSLLPLTQGGEGAAEELPSYLAHTTIPVVYRRVCDVTPL